MGEILFSVIKHNEFSMIHCHYLTSFMCQTPFLLFFHLIYLPNFTAVIHKSSSVLDTGDSILSAIDNVLISQKKNTSFTVPPEEQHTIYKLEFEGTHTTRLIVVSWLALSTIILLTNLVKLRGGYLEMNLLTCLRSCKHR